MRHPDDTKLRCLCGEKKSPQNGACHHSKQGKEKCHVLIFGDILVESIYFYFYEKQLSNTSHATKRTVQQISFEEYYSDFICEYTPPLF
jgi:hypothetical protein